MFYIMNFFIGLCFFNIYAMDLISEQMYSLLTNGSLDELKDFFTKNPDLVNRPVSITRPSFPLNYCLWRKKSEQDTCEAIQIIIDCGANIQATLSGHVDKNTYVPLFVWALSMHSTDILDVLVQNGADINQTDRHGTVLHKLIYYRSKIPDSEAFLKLVKRSLEHGADPNLKASIGGNCLNIINLMKCNIADPALKKCIQETEILLTNAPQIRANYLVQQKQRSLQKDFTRLLKQPNNHTDKTINISDTMYPLHSAMFSARCSITIFLD